MVCLAFAPVVLTVHASTTCEHIASIISEDELGSLPELR
jgi:hypothetical protein